MPWVAMPFLHTVSCFRIDPVAGIVGKDTLQFGIPLFHTDMILIGQLGKNHHLEESFTNPSGELT